MPILHTICMREGGMNRGGARHDGHSTFDLARFTAGQLRELRSEPAIAVIIGGEALTEAHIAELTKAKPEKPKA